MKHVVTFSRDLRQSGEYSLGSGQVDLAKLEAFLVYGANTQHIDLVGLIDSDHESDLVISITLVVGFF